MAASKKTSAKSSAAKAPAPKKGAGAKTSPAAANVGSSKAAGAARSTAALVHGANAYGAKDVKPGFAFTEEDDLLFALDRSLLHYVLDGDPADDDARATVRAGEWTQYRDTWPRQLASHVIRMAVVDGYMWLGKLKIDALGEKAFAKDGPITVAEAKELFAEIFGTTHPIQLGGDLLLMIEAQLGPEASFDAAVAALENAGAAEVMQTDTSRASIVRVLGAVLRRVHRDAGTERRARLEALYRRWEIAHFGGKLPTRKEDEIGLMIRELDMVLHGREAVLRSGDRNDGSISRAEALDVGDDPAFVAEIVKKHGKPEKHETPLPRLVFLGGDAVMDAELKNWKAYAADKQPRIVAAYAPIKSAKVAELMLDMSTASKAKKEAAAWLAEHADFARAALGKRFKR